MIEDVKMKNQQKPIKCYFNDFRKQDITEEKLQNILNDLKSFAEENGNQLLHIYDRYRDRKCDGKTPRSGRGDWRF